uniref:SAWADEE domain-containing protein n=2 Tax=Kalanchoe fedtschenkoi TaxID=63787 RepID=A0A7N0V5Z8_KALFE
MHAEFFPAMEMDHQDRNNTSPNEWAKLSTVPKVRPANKPLDGSKKGKDDEADLSKVEFEARSSKDGAWYDVDRILSHRSLPSGEVEVHVRFLGFGADEDEWVNLASSVRERSVPIEPYDCHLVNVGDILLCYQEKRDQAIYYDVRVLEIERRTHDMRGCRCLFSVQKEYDKSEEKVWLRRLCWCRKSPGH